MHRNKILSIPDFIANAGGLICASLEYHGGTQTRAMAAIEEQRIRANTSEVLRQAQNTDGRLSGRRSDALPAPLKRPRGIIRAFVQSR
jgi:glutamate dehydrogenase/leucine dehydrogenase